MAKGDSARAQNAIDTQQKQAQGGLDTLNQGVLYPQYQQFSNNYGNAVNTNLPNYSDIMNSYNQFLTGQNPTGQRQQPQQTQQNTAGPVMRFPQSSAAGNQMPQDLGYASNHPGSSSQSSQLPAITEKTTDPAVIGQWLQAQSQQPGSDPILKTPEGIKYYTDQILSKPDALNPDNTAYWQKKSTLSSAGGDVGAGGNSGNGAISGWQDFASTGGFSPQDIANIRARSIAPIRSIYSSAQANIDRQRELQRGYSPNYTAAQAKMARDESSQLADAATNAEAGIGQMVQQGKLSGLGGLTGAQLGALGQMTSLYGATPGLTNMFGNQVLQSSGQLGNAQGMQNQLSLGFPSLQIQKAGVPGNYQQALGNIGSTLGLAGNVVGGLTGLFNPSKPLSMGGYGA